MKLSVIVPLYNHGRFLPECIRSIFSNQTDLDFEVIIVNDCSIDNSLKVADKIAKQSDGRIRVVSTPKNLGLTGARNFGIAETTSETDFIVCLDSDDMIMKNYFQQCYKLIEEKNIDISYTDMYLFGAVEKRMNVPEFAKSILQQSPFIHCASMYKRSMWVELGGYDESIKYCWEDYDFWIRAVVADYKPMKCTSTALLYRQHVDSITAKVSPKQFEETKRKLRSKLFKFVTF